MKSLKTSAIETTNIAVRKDKIQWLAVLQGWAMLLVVVGHTKFVDFSTNEIYAFCQITSKIIYSFHMPLFMFISGGLLYLSRMQKKWKYKQIITDKLKYLGMPYVFFITLTFLLKYAGNPYMKRKVDFSLQDFFMSFIDPGNSPLKEMWFIATLFTLMMFYPVYQLTVRKKKYEVMLIAISILFFFTPDPISEDGINILNIAGLHTYMIFFVCGILFFKYQIYNILGSWYWLAVLCMLFCVSFLFYKIPIITALLGIGMSFSLCKTISRFFPELFSSFRDYTFQIFLIGIFPQMFVELFLWKKLQSPNFFIPIYLLSILLAIYSSVFIAKLIQRSKNKYIMLCFGVK